MTADDLPTEITIDQVRAAFTALGLPAPEQFGQLTVIPNEIQLTRADVTISPGGSMTYRSSHLTRHVIPLVPR